MVLHVRLMLFIIHSSFHKEVLFFTLKSFLALLRELFLAKINNLKNFGTIAGDKTIKDIMFIKY